MSLNALAQAQQLLSQPNLLRSLLGELQGLNISVIDGAAAGTGMALAAIRTEDTILQAIKFSDTWAAPVSDLANITIQPTKASGTLTVSGNPVAGETFVVNGNTYTWRATPTKVNEVKITAGANNTMASAVAAAINAYEGRYESQLNGDGNRTAGVVATVASAVVTVTSIADGVGNAPQITGTVTVLAAAGTNTGSATLTAVSVVDGNTCVVNGVTFTAKTTLTVPAVDTEFLVKGTDTLQAAEIVRCLSAYQFKYGTIGVVATSALGVVTIVPNSATTGNAVSMTEASTNFAASGSGYLSGGTATGSIKSTTDLSLATLVLFWANKQ